VTRKPNTANAGLSLDQLADRAASVVVSEPVLLGRGYQPYERFVAHIARTGKAPLVQQRDILRGGRVVGVLPIDLSRGEVVLLRQFRLAAHLATGCGDMVEIVAGRLEAEEDPADCARRECVEEIGVAPSALVPLLTLMPTPGIADEHAQLFAGLVDAGRIVERGGVDHESEETRPFRVPIGAAIAAADNGRIVNALLIVALQWLALNRARLDAIFKSRAK
jgi:ADP-ribose pyrophosphatase